MIQVIERALNILEHLALKPEEEFSLSQIAESCGKNKTTAANILKSLGSRGYVSHTGKMKGYSLGYKASVSLWDLAKTYIRSLYCLYEGKRLFATNRKQRMFHAQHKVLISREEMAERQKWEYWTDIATFDPLYGPETDFMKYDWHVTGGTAVSAEHQCIDAWGGIMAADLMELTDITSNPMWERIGRLMWANAVQGITTRLGEFYHDMQRPIGAQNEGFFQARYTKYRPVIEAGYWNDIFVSWPNSYRLWTLDRVREQGKRLK